MRFRKEIEVARPVEEVFDYVADFSNTSEWDPGVVEARKLADAPVAVGSEFDVVAVFRGKRQPFRYVVTSFERNKRIVLAGDGQRARSIDEVTFHPAGAGTRLAYTADIHLKGVFRVGEPFMSRVFSRMGDEALAGLKSVLDRAA